LKIYERYVFAFVGFQVEGGGFGAGFQHGVTSCKDALILDASPDGKAASGRRTPNAPAPTTPGRYKGKMAAQSRPYKG
jgi:hypothetical protein